MIVYSNTTSKKTQKQKAKQRAAWVAQQQKIGATSAKPRTTKLTIARVVPIRPGADFYTNIKSVQTTDCDTFKRETYKYTGDNMIGICQMSKSNAVPVFNQAHVVEIGKMRRG